MHRSIHDVLAAVAVLVVLATACGRTPLYGGPTSDGGAGGQGASASGPGGQSSGGQGPGGQSSGGQGPGGQSSGGQGPGGQGPGGQGGGGQGGGPPVCQTPLDCDDSDFCTTDLCLAGSCSFTLKDSDADAFVDETCGGTDCNDLNPNVFPGHPEVCTDAADNDCNGVADCQDPACFFVPLCGCIPSPNGEQCTNTLDDDCDTTVDCNDADCIGTQACGCTSDEIGLCQDGIDNDCDQSLDCADSDCASSMACQCQATPENCSNKQDDDCDLLIDCADPNCFGSFACSCVPPGTPEVCNDNMDNDCDGDVDCADANCVANPACAMCMPEVCNDTLDNDCDLLIDCADDACVFSPFCTPTPEICNNSLDDDFDGLTDCDDPDCSNNPFCVAEQGNCLTAKLIPGTSTHTGDTTGHINHYMGSCGGGAGEAVFYFTLSQPSYVLLDTVGSSFDTVLHVRFGDCEAGAEIACDDDSGGFQWSSRIELPILYPATYYVFLDGFTVDPFLGANEGPFVLHATILPNPTEICTDSIDNDGDHWVDCADPQCTTFPTCLNCNQGNPPAPEHGTGACTDSQDNDCDGDVDCADEDCSASPYATECCDGDDDNDNGIVDDWSCRCASSSDCIMGQICYTATIWSCGLPCNQFFGNVCPAVALGSYCNNATQQCQF